MTSLSPCSLGPEDWVAFALRYWLDLAILITASAVPLLARRLFGADKVTLRYLALAAVLLGGLCVLHIGLTAKRNFVLTLLGAEDDHLAEAAYREFARSAQLDELISLVLSQREAENIRFYATCIIADSLRARDEQSVTSVLKRVGGARDIRPQFFSTNSMNSFHPTAAGTISPRDLLAARLGRGRGDKETGSAL